jgi:diadenosine tetraphosphate (Ap4A) HIT family hydrolase
MSQDECSICKMLDAVGEDEIVIDTDLFRAHTVFDAPGWTMVSSKRHAEGIWGLTDAEASAFGTIANQLARAMRAEATAERVHVLAQGEHALHFHAILVPRQPGETPVFEGTELVVRGQQLADRDRTLSVAAAMRESVGVPVA